jgi:hypothetical protein
MGGGGGGSGGGGGPGSDTTAIHQGGDIFGTDIVVGPKDAHDLVWQANSATAWRLDHVSGSLLPEGDKDFAIGAINKRLSRVFSDRFDIFSDTGGWVSSLSESGLELGDGAPGHPTDILVFRNPSTKEVNATTFSGTYALTPGGSPLTTKGDLFTFSSAVARFPLGTADQILMVDPTTATGLKWGTGSGTVDATAWHYNLDTFGAAKKIGTVDDFGFAIYSHNINIGTFFDPRGAGTISAFSGMAFLSDLSIPGDSIYWLKNTDATPSANSSCELQFSSDVATLQIFTLNSNNPARAPQGEVFDMAPNEAAIFSYNNPLDIVTGLDHPIQFILNGIRMCFMDTTGLVPQVDGSIATTSLGSATKTWDAVFAQEGVFKFNMAIGTAGGASTLGEIISGAFGEQFFHFYDDGSAITWLKSHSAVGHYSIIQSESGSGAESGAAAIFRLLNTDGDYCTLNLSDSGSATTYNQKLNFMTIGASAGKGVRCNVNAADDSGWAIDSSGHMTIFAAQVGLYGHATVAQQTVTGSRGSGAALVDLLTKLAATGIIIDGTSA